MRYQTAAEMATALDDLAGALERRRTSDPLTALYQEGVRAFEQGRWKVAVERLDRIVAVDPDYEDAAVLLEMAMSESRHAH